MKRGKNEMEQEVGEGWLAKGGTGKGVYRLPKPAKEASQGMMMTMMKSKRKQNCSTVLRLELKLALALESTVERDAEEGERKQKAGGGRQEAKAAAPSTAERMTETCFAERMRLWAIGV